MKIDSFNWLRLVKTAAGPVAENRAPNINRGNVWIIEARKGSENCHAICCSWGRRTKGSTSLTSSACSGLTRPSDFVDRFNPTMIHPTSINGKCLSEGSLIVSNTMWYDFLVYCKNDNGTTPRSWPRVLSSSCLWRWIEKHIFAVDINLHRR